MSNTTIFSETISWQMGHVIDWSTLLFPNRLTYLGLMSEKAARKVAKALGWNLTIGFLAPSENCAIRKGLQNTVLKDTGDPMTTLDTGCISGICGLFLFRQSNH
jgi:hypothetical protein